MRFCAVRLRMCAVVTAVLFACLSCVALADTPAVAPGTASTESVDTIRSPAEERLWKAVSAVNDPELDIGIVDLGLVRRIVVNETPQAGEPQIILTLVLTSPLCPYAKDLLRDIRDAVQTEMPQHRLKVVIDGKTRWTPALMTEEGKRRFAGES